MHIIIDFARLSTIIYTSLLNAVLLLKPNHHPYDIYKNMTKKQLFSI